MTDKGKMISYSEMNCDDCESLKNTISSLISELLSVAEKGKEAIKDCYFIKKNQKYAYILGTITADYFALPLENFKYHICLEPDDKVGS